MSYSLHVYLNFPGTTREVLGHYRSIFGGEVTLFTFGQYHAVPEGSPSADLIMHGSLIAERFSLFASDEIPEMPGGVTYGDNVHLSLMGKGPDALEELTVVFDKLADGGNVVMLLEKQVWGDFYGNVVDRFGVSWMVNVDGGGAEA